MQLSSFLNIVYTALIIICFLIFCLRLCGLRSFSKMTGFDFAITIAVGTVLATPIISSETSTERGLVALGALFIIQYLISYVRKHSEVFSSIIDNTPKFLFKNGRFNEKNLNSSRVSKSDVIAKMREANATDLSKVTAIVLESTGDISVLHGDKAVDKIMYDGVRD